MTLFDIWNSIRLFHQKAGQPVSDYPVPVEFDRAKLRKEWIIEELVEFIAARGITEQADAMIDIIYYALGTLVEMGIRPSELMSIVCKANLQKIDEDGKVCKRQDGKTIKPLGWKDPTAKMRAEINRQITKYRFKTPPE